ncbi:MAG: hypothetical protein GY757_57225 [bacterium]|nr:hypothetical protein [bacterium]
MDGFRNGPSGAFNVFFTLFGPHWGLFIASKTLEKKDNPATLLAEGLRMARYIFLVWYVFFWVSNNFSHIPFSSGVIEWITKEKGISHQ